MIDIDELLLVVPLSVWISDESDLWEMGEQIYAQKMGWA